MDREETLTVLIAEDDKAHREALERLLKDWGYNVRLASDGAEAIKICRDTPPPDLALLDVRMPRKDGMEVLREIKESRPELPVILMTAYSEIPDAVDSIREGAFDYLAKPLDFSKLRITLRNAAVQAGLIRENEKLKKDAEKGRRGVLGVAPATLKFLDLIDVIAPSEAPVLILGESGVGKELAARAVHAASAHANGPFVAINCGALTESLLTSELFGHEKGAFTGADKKRDGLFLEAGTGSVFLDEIGETPPAMQVKLLRVLQEREVIPAGGSRPTPIKCRVIAATNRDLAEEVKKGNFREDLYYRLNVAPVRVPPLRERREDIPLLARAFAEKFAGENHKNFKSLTPEALEILRKWPWPGNVRELQNTMERAIILMTGEYVGKRELPDRMLERAPAARMEESEFAEDGTLAEIERKIILRTLEKLNGNKTETAKALGITRKTLHAKLNRYKAEEEN